MENNWITIYDNSSAANIVYVSDSITDHTGWEPDEVIGKNAFAFFHPGDHASLHKVHIANVMNEKMSSMVSYRFLCKDGSNIPVETVIHYCHDVLMATNFLFDENSEDHKMRANSVDEVFACHPDGSLELIGAWNDQQEKMQRSLTVRHDWVSERVAHSQELRFCLILNRFTDALCMVYISKLAKQLVGLDPENDVGRSIFEFVGERDLGILQRQLDMAKEFDMVVRLRFDWIINKEKGLSEPVEAITSSTDDGLVVVLRLSPRLFVNDDQLKQV
jgi:PAS domain S-box-containing protein